MGHRFSVGILIIITEFAIKLVLEECSMAKSYLNPGLDFGSLFCCRLNSRTGSV